MPNYVRVFGLFPGLWLLLRIERTNWRSSSCTAEYRLPNYEQPITMRRTRADHATFWQCLVREQYDTCHWLHHRQLIADYNRRASSGERLLIIDGGANIGLASIWYAKQFPEALVLAVEPDESNFALLKENTSDYDGQIRCLRGAVWHRDSFVKIVNPKSGAASFQVVETDASDPARVEAFSIEKLCGLGGTAFPFIVKLDIEGTQKSLFEENTDWLGRTQLVTLELDDWQMPWQGTSRSFFESTVRFPFDYLIGQESVFCFLHQLPRETVGN